MPVASTLQHLIERPGEVIIHRTSEHSRSRSPSTPVHLTLHSATKFLYFLETFYCLLNFHSFPINTFYSNILSMAEGGQGKDTVPGVGLMIERSNDVEQSFKSAVAEGYRVHF